MTIPIVKQKKNVYSDVYEDAYSLKELIDHTDIDESAESWDEVSQHDIDEEVRKSTEVAMDESQFANKAKRLARSVWVKDLNRASMSDLLFDSEKEALKQGYLPRKMSWREAEDQLAQMINRNETSIPNAAWDESYTVIRAAVVDKLDPNAQKGESLLYDFK